MSVLVCIESFVGVQGGVLSTDAEYSINQIYIESGAMSYSKSGKRERELFKIQQERTRVIQIPARSV